MNLDALRKIIKEELIKKMNGADPNKPRYNIGGLEDNSINGTIKLLNDSPELVQDMEVQKALKMVLRQLDLKTLQNLNRAIKNQTGKVSPPTKSDTEDTAKMADIEKYGSRGL